MIIAPPWLLSMTESAFAPALSCGDAMCIKCDDIQKQITQYNRFLNQNLDPLTEVWMRTAVADLEQRKAQLHWAPLTAEANSLGVL
jgi:hypothetical protein